MRVLGLTLPLVSEPKMSRFSPVSVNTSSNEPLYCRQRYFEHWSQLFFFFFFCVSCFINHQQLAVLRSFNNLLDKYITYRSGHVSFPSFLRFSVDPSAITQYLLPTTIYDGLRITWRFHILLSLLPLNSIPAYYKVISSLRRRLLSPLLCSVRTAIIY